MKIINAHKLPETFFTLAEPEATKIVKEILNAVKQKGDAAVRRYTLRFDGVALPQFRITAPALTQAEKAVPRPLRQAIKVAADNIRKFATAQFKQFKDFEMEIKPGVFSGQKVIAIDRVGVYVPGGNYPLISSLLMGAIPAQVAGVREIAVCSPPTCDHSLHPAILYAMAFLGLEEIYAIGGVQAIGAMAYGTPTVKKVNKIVGPGNRFVALAKKEVCGVVGIDFIAGPTEVVIIADQTADPRLVAADLIAQAEHDPAACPILITIAKELAEKTNKEIAKQLRTLPTAAIARQALANQGLIIMANDLSEAVAICNRKAPEHVQLQTRNPEKLSGQLRNYGSLFIGANAAEVFGDYSSGLNHTLPTGQAAMHSGGLSVKDFLKLQTTLRVEPKGLAAIGPTALALAEAEGLAGHARAVSLRLKN
jgi:sulfopropanediol 3-dehydrogenase